jgi:hypothetical protein
MVFPYDLFPGGRYFHISDSFFGLDMPERTTICRDCRAMTCPRCCSKEHRELVCASNDVDSKTKTCITYFVEMDFICNKCKVRFHMENMFIPDPYLIASPRGGFYNFCVHKVSTAWGDTSPKFIEMTPEQYLHAFASSDWKTCFGVGAVYKCAQYLMKENRVNYIKKREIGSKK